MIFRRRLLHVYHRVNKHLTVVDISLTVLFFFSLLVLYVDVESDLHAKVPVVVCKDRKRLVTVKRK